MIFLGFYILNVAVIRLYMCGVSQLRARLASGTMLLPAKITASDDCVPMIVIVIKYVEGSD